MTRLLVQFKGHEMGEELQLLATYNDPNDAVKDALFLLDETVDNFFVNKGEQWLRIYSKSKL